MATIKQIKTAQNYLGWDDETYRAALKQHTGKDSATKCTTFELDKLLQHMKRCGFNTTSKQGKKPGKSANNAVLSKIEAILADKKLPWSYAEAMAKRMFGIDKIAWLADEELRKLLQALIIYQNRSK